MIKKSMILLFLGLALAVGGWSADDGQELAWEAKMEKVSRLLRENGVEEDRVAHVLQDMARTRERMAERERKLAQDSLNEGQGYEGAVNTSYGYLAGSAITTGTGNCFFGRTAGKNITTGNGNTILGHKAGFNNQWGMGNIFIGHLAGYKDTTYSGFNTFVGTYAGSENIDGSYNTFVGGAAGSNNIGGSDNTFIGDETGVSNMEGSYNIFVGRGSGYDNTTGCFNVFIGNEAGANNSTGSGNVFIGYAAGVYETGSNKLYIDNSNTTTPLIYGDFSANRVGINNSAPGYTFVVGTGGARCNGTAWIDGSSREVKENVEALAAEEALQAVAGLEPVKFNYREEKGEKCLGFIAEEVPDLVAMNDRQGLSPMDIVAVLTRVVQEQMKVNQEQQKVITALEARLAALEQGSTGNR